MQWEGCLVVDLILKRRIPDRHRIEIGFDPRAIFLRRQDIAVAPGREPKFLHRLAVELQDHRVCITVETKLGRKFQVVLVGMLEVEFVRLQLAPPVAAILDIFLKLLRIDGTLAFLRAILAAPAHEGADARRTLVIDDVVGIPAGELGAAVLVRHARQAQSDTNL